MLYILADGIILIVLATLLHTQDFESIPALIIMNYNKFLFFLLFNLSLCAALHAGMQDRAYNEVLIDNVTHPNGDSVSLAVGPEGRLYVTYERSYDGPTGNYTDGWVEVYSPEGILLATIDRSYVPYLANSSSDFSPGSVLPGPGGIFTVSHGNWLTVIDSNFQTYSTTDYLGTIDYDYGWTRSLDGGFVTFYTNGSLIRRIRDANGNVIESENIADNAHNFWFIGYKLSYSTLSYGDYGEEFTPNYLTYDADGVLQNMDSPTGLVTINGSDRIIGNPYIENGQVVVARRAYRTKGDTNAIPVPSIVSVAQVPDTTLIDITYRVDDADDATVTTGILASMTDGQGNTTRIPLSTLSGGTADNIGMAVATNTDLTVTWDAGVDWGAAFGDVSFDVYANDGRPVLGFHMLTLPLPSGDLTISRSPVNDLEIKEALYYLWATGQGIRLDNGQLVGQGGFFEGVPLGTPEAPVTETSTGMLFYLLGLEEASDEQVDAAREGFDANTEYQFTSKNPIRGDLLENFSANYYISGSEQYIRFDSLPYAVNELGFDSIPTDLIYSNNPLKWVVPATTLQVLGEESLSISGAGGDVSFTMLDPSNEGWSISNLPDWLSASASSGVGDATITLSAATENAGISSRSATVDLNDGARSITVSQNGNIFPDNFADRYALTGNSGSFSINNVNATLEPGEPSHNYIGENSLWFTFTAPAYGEFFMSVSTNSGSGISVYSGDELATLVNNDNGSSTFLYPNQGQTYHIAVTNSGAEHGGSPGDINISYSFYSYEGI